MARSLYHKPTYGYTMATKDITITDDAYERLQALKRNGESLSDLITRLTEGEEPMAFAGSCPGLSDHVTREGSDLGEDLQEHHDELFG